MDYNFNLASNERDEVSLDSFKGKKLVLYFYPKDNTSGCTIEAQEFTELYKDFQNLNTEIVGVSRDSKKSHDNFSKKYDIPYELLIDKDRELADQYGILKEAKMYGKDVIKTIRSTFVFDEDSNLIKEFRDVKAPGHAKEVLDFIKSLEA